MPHWNIPIKNFIIDVEFCECFRYIMEDLKSQQFKERGIENNYDNLIENLANNDFILLGNLLMSDTVGPELIPILEKEWIADAIQHYIKSKYDLSYVDLLMTNF